MDIGCQEVVIICVCGHKLLSRIFRCTLILLSTLDPDSTVAERHVSVSHQRREQNCLLTKKEQLVMMTNCSFLRWCAH